MNTSNTDSFLRLPQIIGNVKVALKAQKAGLNVPIIEPIIPVCASSWWHGVSTGKYPKPLKLGARTTVWRKSEVMALLEKGAQNDDK